MNDYITMLILSIAFYIFAISVLVYNFVVKRGMSKKTLQDYATWKTKYDYKSPYAPTFQLDIFSIFSCIAAFLAFILLFFTIPENKMLIPCVIYTLLIFGILLYNMYFYIGWSSQRKNDYQNWIVNNRLKITDASLEPTVEINYLCITILFITGIILSVLSYLYK